jgi:hypothetical protein
MEQEDQVGFRHGRDRAQIVGTRGLLQLLDVRSKKRISMEILNENRCQIIFTVDNRSFPDFPCEKTI